MKKHGFIAFFLFIALVSSSCSVPERQTNVPDELSELDAQLERASGYDCAKRHDIDSVAALLKQTPQSDSSRLWELNTALGGLYRTFCSDSSALYHREALELAASLGNDSLTAESRMALAYADAASGLFLPSQRQLDLIDTAALTRGQRLDFNRVGRRLSANMLEYAKGNSEVTPQISRRNEHAEQYLIDHLPADDLERLFILAQNMHRHGDDRQALKIADRVLASTPKEGNLYGMTAYLRADIARAQGDEQAYGRYLALAAISDIKGSVKETMALTALAKWLYNQGEVDRAYTYINASLQDAMAADARMRTIEVASLLPMIDGAYKKKLATQRDQLAFYFCLAAVLLLVCGVLLVLTFRSMRRAGTARAKLEAQSKTQEGYIGHILGLCSSYSSRLESLRRLVDRKISVGQTDELLKMIKSGRFADTEDDDFFKIFDETFLDIYPGFIADLNSLLRPDAQIEQLPGAPLSTELRIYAFLRLGLTDTGKIARVLRCSPNTVYAYRNRMRNRARIREGFDEAVMKL